MPKVKVDMTGASKEIEAIPSGVYEGTIVDIELKEAQASGFPYMQVAVNIDDGEYTGRRVYGNVHLPHDGRKAEGQSAAKRSLGKYNVALGRDPEDGDFDTDDDLNAKVKVNVKKQAATEEYEERSQIQSFLPR